MPGGLTLMCCIFCSLQNSALRATRRTLINLFLLILTGSAIFTPCMLGQTNPVPTITNASNPSQALAGATASITLTGTGFMSSTVILVNGVAVPATYQSSTTMIAQVTAPAGSTSNLAVTAQNPAPGGGISATAFQLGTANLQLTATDPDGTNTGTAQLGIPVSFSTINTDTSHQTQSWTLQGAGTLTASGTNNVNATYTPPTTMPASSTVTITTYLTNLPALTTSYTFTLVNPVPTISSVHPTQALAGTTTSITLTGTGFVSDTVILVNGTAAPATYQSPTTIVAQITTPAGSTSNLAVAAQNPAPGGGNSTSAQLGTASLQLTAIDADGTNTGTARLGIPVNFSTVDTDTAHQTQSWTLQGAGTLSYSGTNNANAIYTPPTTMPTNPAVTVTTYLSNLPALTTSYTFTLVNPALTVSSATPTQLLTGGTQTVTLNGAGFLPGTTVSLNGTALPLTYVSYTQATVQVPVAANATGTLTLQLQNPASGGSLVSYALPIAVDSIALSPATQTGSVVTVGSSLAMAATVTGSLSTAVTWGVSGDGTISSAGTYVAPTTPSTGSAVITATLTCNPTITASYPLTLVNPLPLVSAASPTQALAGATTSITLTGTGFVPATVILVNGAAVPVTYQSGTTIVAQIAAPAGATGNLAVQGQNPAPGGGTSTVAFQLGTASLQLTATDGDGTNTGTARLGVPVTLSTVNTDTAYASQSWTLQGAGTISYSGTNNVNATYTPPTTMPANPTVTITTYLSALPALTTSYTFTLINPVATVNSATPTQLLTGGTQTVTLAGSGFVPGTTVLLNGTALPITYVSYTQATVQVPVAANATGTLALQLQNPASGGSPVSYSLPIAVDSIVLAPATQTGPVVALGGSLTMAATVSGSVSTAVTWSVSGDGTISSTGTYVAPATLSTGSAVITAALVSNPSITASYPLTFLDPPPVLNTASPSQALAGATTSFTLTGTGFVPATVILVNGAAVPATYQSATTIVAQIAASAGATGNLAVQAQNPAPGGGTSSTLQLSVASLQLTATDPDGTNTGTARLGVPVNLSTVNTDTAHQAQSWTLQGAGTLTYSGTNNVNATYTPPTTMPANPTVTITTYLSALPALTTSYTFTLNYGLPTVTSANPSQALAGATVPITLTGTGFMSSTVILVNGAAVPTTYQSATSVVAQVTAAAGSTSNLAVQAQNPAPGGGVSATAYQLGTASLQLTATDPDGTNTGKARLGLPLNFSTINTDTAHAAQVWNLQGAGTLSYSGANNVNATYTPPSTMPANPTVTITTYLASLPALTTSYTFTLIYGVPTITSANPSQALAGATVPITFAGTEFTPNTVILVNGAAVPTTYQSATSIIAQVTAAPGSTSNLAVTGQNPAPGGGTNATAFQLGTANLQLTATDLDGTNTGTARLGVPVNFSTVNTDTAHAALSWTLQGAGTLSYNGTNNANATYTPPTTMPANPTVTVTTFLGSLPALTTSYTFTLVNPVPTVSSATPTQLLSGGSQTLTLTGAGFMPGTTVSLNGTTYPIVYSSYSAATAQVTVAPDAAGTLTLQIQNPAPVGGSSTFTESVVPNSIALTATNSDGTPNTGTEVLWGQINMSATVTGSMQTAINWSVTGAGSITSAGVYCAPTAMPASQSVIIQAALASNPAITSSYALTIINPSPAITAASPTAVPAGTTTAVTLTGTGFVPSTVIQVNGVVVPSTYVTHHSIVAQITPDATATGDLQVQASTSTFTGGVSDFFDIAVLTPISATAAARLLDQTTFGPTTALIPHVQQEGVTAWLAEQFNTPQTFLPIISSNTPPTPYCFPVHCFESEWWQTVITGNDQLRQRVALALGELFVVSTDTVEGWGLQQYSDMFARDAFSNWYNIMNDVTLSPAMGIYLNMLNSAKPTGTLIANENFARENMQLFNLGLDLINQDGTLHVDPNGNPIPAYTEAQVEAFSRLYTGWTYANADGSTPAQFNTTPNYYSPLVAVESQHDENPKTLLNGTVLPAGQTAEEDLAAGLTNIFQHPNLPPFVCKQLIQHLVKSDPSPGYVSRVAEVFINDGANVRGNMQAVLTAIFTDPEARAGDTAPQASDGHLREPVLWMTAVMRGLGYVNIDPNNYWAWLSNYSAVLGEEPYQASSVFNFFPIGYVIPGTTLNAPEFGLENTASVVDRLNLANNLVNNSITGFNVDLSATSPLGQILTSQGPAALVNALNGLFLYGTMDSNTALAITNEITPLSNNPAQELRLATYLTITSSEYKILH